MGFRVQGFGFREYRVLGFREWGLGLGSRVEGLFGLGSKVWGSGSRVKGLQRSRIGAWGSFGEALLQYCITCLRIYGFYLYTFMYVHKYRCTYT